MAYIYGAAPCCRCQQVFIFNPMRVPSVIIKGVRQPVCSDCIAPLNALRRTLGNPEIVPLPGAYDACDEAELSE
jgi:hypothetical protein